jgi:D-lactate dehydrogenase
VEKMRIAFFEVKELEEEYLKRKLDGHILKFSNEKLSLENVLQIKDFDSVSVFIYSKIDEQIIQAIPNLKLITTRSTGYDHIDIDSSKKHGITICNVPSYGETLWLNTRLL